MSKKIAISVFLIIGILLLNSCSVAGGSEGESMVMGKEQRADSRMEKIVAALKVKDKESLKALFSKKALDETADFENDVDYLFNFIQGNISTGERDGMASDESIEYGKRSKMLRFAVNINTDEGSYRLFVIDYNTDTINPDNEGVYMLEVRKADTPNTGSWQERMRAGISIIE